MSGDKPDKVIALLQVLEGNKPGQPIANYRVPGERSDSLVFMPSHAPVGQKVRVMIVPVGENDRRGVPLFRAAPTEPFESPYWEDNGDGTASEIGVTRDWLLNEVSRREIQRRVLLNQITLPSHSGSPRSKRRIEFGSTREDSFIVVEGVLSTPLFSEQVEDHQVTLVSAGSREEIQSQDLYEISSIRGLNLESRESQSVMLNWATDLMIQISVTYSKDNREERFQENYLWSSLPSWVQTELQSEWPLCTCGRERVPLAQRAKTDGYPQCNLCRKESPCARCNSIDSSQLLQYFSAKLLCQQCLPYERCEIEIIENLSDLAKGAIADAAHKLLQGSSFNAAAGQVILRSTLSHLETSAAQTLLAQWEGYLWYYFTKEGVYGSKFPPAALRIFELLLSAQGDGLVEVVSWFDGGHRNRGPTDFFLQFTSQTRTPLPSSLRSTIGLLVSGDLTVADRLADSEEDRQECLALATQLRSLPVTDHRHSAGRKLLENLSRSVEYQTFSLQARKLLDSEPPQTTPKGRTSRTSQAGQTLSDALRRAGLGD